MPADLLHPTSSHEKRVHKLKRLVQSPNRVYEMRRSATPGDGRLQREASTGRRTGRSAMSAAQQQLPNEGHARMVLSRAEIQRKTRERSRIAALKLAEEQDKEREHRQETVARKSAAKAFAAQARAGNAGRPRRNPSLASNPNGINGRDGSAEGRRCGDRVFTSGRLNSGTGGSPPGRSSSLSGVHTRGRGRGLGVSSARSSAGAVAGARSSSLNAANSRRREHDAGGKVRESWDSAVAANATNAHQSVEPRLARAQSQQRNGERDARASAPVVGGQDSGGGGGGRRAQEVLSESISLGFRARGMVSSGSRLPGANGRHSEPPLPTLRRRVLTNDGKAKGTGASAAATSVAGGSEKFPANRGRSNSGRRISAGASAAIRGSRRGVDANSKPRSSSSGRSREEKHEESPEQAKRAEREKAELYDREHKKTLVYMARRRKQEALKRRKEEEEKAQKAEHLRRALQHLEQHRRQSMSLPPLRSRTRENCTSSSSSSLRRPPGTSTNSTTVPQRRASSARRRTPVSAVIDDAAFNAAVVAAAVGAARARAAWVNVVDGKPEPPSPREVPNLRRTGARVLRRDIGPSSREVSSHGKENSGRGRGAQRGVSLQRENRTEQQYTPAVETELRQGRSAPDGTSQKRRKVSKRESEDKDNGRRNTAAGHPAPHGSQSFGHGGDVRGGEGTEARREPERQEAWDSYRCLGGQESLEWMESSASDQGHAEEKDASVVRRRHGRVGWREEAELETGAEKSGAVDPASRSRAGKSFERHDRRFQAETAGPVAARNEIAPHPPASSHGTSSVDDQYPEMIQSLQRVADTVKALRGRCDHMTKAMDARDDRREHTRRRIEVGSNRKFSANGAIGAAEAGPRRTEKAVGPASASALVLLTRPPPPDDDRHDQPTARPTITVPAAPVTLPARQPPPLLRPMSPHELAPPSSSSPAISLGVSPVDDVGNRGGRTFVPPADLFSPSPHISLGGEADGASAAPPPWRRISAQMPPTSPPAPATQHTRTDNCPDESDEQEESDVGAVERADAPPGRETTTDAEGGILGASTRRQQGSERHAEQLRDRRVEWTGLGVADSRRASRLPSETFGDSRSQSKLDQALEGLRSGVASVGVSANSNLEYVGRRGRGRDDEDQESLPRRTSSRRAGTNAAGSSGIPSWTEWMARTNGEMKRTDAGEAATDSPRNESEEGRYSSTFSMSAVVAETIATNTNNRRKRAAERAEMREDPHLDSAQNREPLPMHSSQPFAVIPSGWTIEPRADQSPNRPDVWDSLLESGPTLSPDRRFQLQGSRPPVTITAAVPQEASSNEARRRVGSEAGRNSVRTEPAEERKSNEGLGRGTHVVRDSEQHQLEERETVRQGSEQGARLSSGVDEGAGAPGRELEHQRADGRGAALEQKRLSPAELQAQLMNELQLYDELHDVELQADALMAAATVEEARQESRRIVGLLHQERDARAHADDLAIQNQHVFENALARNDAIRDTRLRRERVLAEEQAARHAEAVTASVATAVTASLGAQGRQAAAAIAAVAAAGAHAQSEKAAAMAITAEAAMMSEVQGRTVVGQHGVERADSDGVDEYGGRDDAALAATRREEVEDRSPTTGTEDLSRKKSRKDRTDFDSLLEHSPLPYTDHMLHTSPPSARARARGNDGRSGFWLASPDDGRIPRTTFTSDQHQSRRGDAPRRTSSNAGLSASGLTRGGGAGTRAFGGGEPSPGKLRHSHDGSGAGTGGSASRRQRSQSLGPQNGAWRGGNRAGDSVAGGQAQQDFRRSSGPVGGAANGRASTGRSGINGGSSIGGVRGDASVEYAAVRREIEREREAMSRRTQQQLRQLEAEDDVGKGAGADGRRYSDDRSPGVSDSDESLSAEDERYSSFGSSGSAYEDGNVASGSRPPEEQYARGSGVTEPPSPGLPLHDVENDDDERDYLHVDEGEGDESLCLADSLAQELQEIVVPVAAAGRPSNVEAFVTHDAENNGENGALDEASLQEDSGDASVVPEDVEEGSDADSVQGSPHVPKTEAQTSVVDDEGVVEERPEEVSGDLSEAVALPQEVADEVASILGGEQVPPVLDVEGYRVSGRDANDERDGPDYDNESFEADAADASQAGDKPSPSASEVYSPLVTPPRAENDTDVSHSLDGVGSRCFANNGYQYSQDWEKAPHSRAEQAAVHTSSAASPAVASLEKANPSPHTQPPAEKLDFEEGQKKLDRFMLEAAAARVAGDTRQEVGGGKVSNDRQGASDKPEVDDNSEGHCSRVSAGMERQHPMLVLNHEAQQFSSPARSHILDERSESKLDAEARVGDHEPPHDLLLEGDYKEIEPAKPPEIVQWIALGAVEARKGLSTIQEPPTLRVQCSDGHDARRDDEPNDADFDEDSFASGDGNGEGGGSSETKLTALVAQIAVRGEESRAATILQALARSRRAVRMAAAARGQRAAEEAARESSRSAVEVASLSAGEGAGLGDGEAWETTVRDERGGFIEDMKLLTRKTTQEGLSDSFESVDVVDEDAVIEATTEWTTIAKSKAELPSNRTNPFIDSSREEDRHGGTVEAPASPPSSNLDGGYEGAKLTVTALQDYDVETAVSPAGLDGGTYRDVQTTGKDSMEAFDYEEAVSPPGAAGEFDGADGGNVSARRWNDDSSLALVSPAVDEADSIAEVAEEVRASWSPGGEAGRAEPGNRKSSAEFGFQHDKVSGDMIEKQRVEDGNVELSAAVELNAEGGSTGAEEDGYDSDSFDAEDAVADDTTDRIETSGAITLGDGRNEKEEQMSPTTPVASLPDLSAYIGSDVPSTDEKRSLSLAPWQRLVFDDESPTGMNGNEAPPSPESVQPLVTPRATEDVSVDVGEGEESCEPIEPSTVGAVGPLGSFDHVENAEIRAHDLSLHSPAEPTTYSEASRPGSFLAEQDYVEAAELPGLPTLDGEGREPPGCQKPTESNGLRVMSAMSGDGEGIGDVPVDEEKAEDGIMADGRHDSSKDGSEVALESMPLPVPIRAVAQSLENKEYDYVENAAASVPGTLDTAKMPKSAFGFTEHLDDKVGEAQVATTGAVSKAPPQPSASRLLDEQGYEHIEVAAARTNVAGVESDGKQEGASQEVELEDERSATASAVITLPAEISEEKSCRSDVSRKDAPTARPRSEFSEVLSEIEGDNSRTETLIGIAEHKSSSTSDDNGGLEWKAKQRERSTETRKEAGATLDKPVPSPLCEIIDYEEVAVQPDEVLEHDVICGTLVRDVVIEERRAEQLVSETDATRVAAQVSKVPDEAEIVCVSSERIDGVVSSTVGKAVASPEMVKLDYAADPGVSSPNDLSEDVDPLAHASEGREDAPLERQSTQESTHSVSVDETLQVKNSPKRDREENDEEVGEKRMDKRDSGAAPTVSSAAAAAGKLPEADVPDKYLDDRERLVDTITDELMGDLIGKLLGSPAQAQSPSEVSVTITSRIDLGLPRDGAAESPTDDAEMLEDACRYTWDSAEGDDDGGSLSSGGHARDCREDVEEQLTPREKEEEEWGKAQLMETIGNEGGIVIAGEEDGEDSWDRARISPPFSPEVGRLMFTATAEGELHTKVEVVSATGVGKEGGWGKTGMDETYDGESSSEAHGDDRVRTKSEEGVIAVEARRPGDIDAALGHAEATGEDDDYYFPPAPLARPKKPWAALAALATSQDDEEVDPFTGYPAAGTGEVSFGVRTGGGDASVTSETNPLAPVSETQEMSMSPIPEEGEDEFREGSTVPVDGELDDGQAFMNDLLMEYPEFPWWPVLASTIETALGSMTLDELNERMAMHNLPEEPYIEELYGEDTLEFPPPEDIPLEHEAVIPPRVIDKLFNATDEEVAAGIQELEGIPLPDRDCIDSARWTAFDAANEYLAEKRAERAPRRDSDGPSAELKLLHRMPGYRHFSSMEHAILEVTEAILRQDGACLPGREPNPDFTEMLPLDNKPQTWVYHEDDMYFVKCKVAEDILEDLVDDTLQSCKQVFALRHEARRRWSKQKQLEQQPLR